MRFEPAQVIFLGYAGTEQEVMVATGIGDGEIADQLAVVIEHRRERDPPFARKPVRKQMIQP